MAPAGMRARVARERRPAASSLSARRSRRRRRQRSAPLAPLTVTVFAAIVAVTPCGRSTGRFATRLTWYAVLSLGHDAEDFAALADGARLVVRHHALGRGDDHGAHAAQHLRQLVLAAIDAQAGRADALEAVDDRAAFVVLQARWSGVGLPPSCARWKSADVAFVLQHLDDAPSSASKTTCSPRSCAPAARCGCGSGDRQWDQSCSCLRSSPARLGQARESRRG